LNVGNIVSWLLWLPLNIHSSAFICLPLSIDGLVGSSLYFVCCCSSFCHFKWLNSVVSLFCSLRVLFSQNLFVTIFSFSFLPCSCQFVIVVFFLLDSFLFLCCVVCIILLIIVAVFEFGSCCVCHQFVLFVWSSCFSCSLLCSFWNCSSCCSCCVYFHSSCVIGIVFLFVSLPLCPTCLIGWIFLLISFFVVFHVWVVLFILS